jgi:hypothetical protein
MSRHKRQFLSFVQQRHCMAFLLALLLQALHVELG